MSTKPSIVEIACREVLRELVSYTEADIAPDMAARIGAHLKNCRHCLAIYDGARNIVTLLGDRAAFELPQGFSQRLYQRVIKAPHA